VTDTNTLRRYVDIDKDDVEWFNQTYPKGSFNWLFNMLLKEFRRAHTITPQDYALIGAREIMKQVKEEDSGA
jgi:hypothetical protein